jgi:hypothetical protein
LKTLRCGSVSGFRGDASRRGGLAPLLLVVVALCPSAARAATHGLYQAESAKLQSSMKVGSDVNALGGKYIAPTSGTSSTSPTAEARRSFSVPSTGTYYLWARMMGPDAGSDTLYVGIDSSWDRISPSTTGVYEWVAVETRLDNGVRGFWLTAGTHTLKAGRGELKTRLDAWYLTSDPNDVPTSSPAAAAPTVSLSASPSSITSGQSSTLSWTSTNATSCTASGGWSGNLTTSGMKTVSPTASTTYTLSCTGSGGTASASTTVTVSAPAPTVSISASPTSITSGQSSSISWTSTNATGCSASGGWSGSKATSGSESVSPSTTTTYTLTCTGGGGSASGSTAVNVTSTTTTSSSTTTTTTQTQGFGADTSGGSGKPLYHVTNLNDSGAGSLRDAVSQGNRDVVFDVAGTINAASNIYVKGALITIDGTTAPSPGITLSGYGLGIWGSKGAHDVIVRGIRIRNVAVDGININQEAYNVLVDHVSIGDTGDGSIDVTYGAHDVTVQWSILEKKPTHDLLSLNSYGATRLTYHHDLFIGGESRNPQVDWNITGTPPEIVVDVRNNVIWDFSQYGTTVLRGALANVVANYYWSSTQSDPGRALRVTSSTEGSRAYTHGNVSQNGGNVDAEGTESVPFAAEPVDTTDACTAAKDVVAYAGPHPLDTVDENFVSQVKLTCN